MAQVAKDDRVKDAIKNVQRYATVPEVSPAKSHRSGPNAFQWVLIGVGAVAVASAAYAAWQTLRADDDLWIEDLDEITGGGGVDREQGVEASQRPGDEGHRRKEGDLLGDGAVGGAVDPKPDPGGRTALVT